MTQEIAANLKRIDEALGRYVRPDTFPLAIRMVKPDEKLPPDVKVPSEVSSARPPTRKHFA